MSSKYIIAIDPGCPATMTFTRNGRLIACASGEQTAMLTYKQRPDKKPLKKWMPCYDYIRGLTLTWVKYARANDLPVEIVLERVGAMPEQGLTSMSKLVACVAYVRGMAETLVANELVDDFTFVTPQVWKKKMREVYPDFNVKGGKEYKYESLRLARHVFIESPRAQKRLKYKKDHDYAEAMLLGHYGELVGK